ncbi:hypothetical protein [Roseateles sp.]|uniref:hypothetical protein n=1 Tax=Roseateles sp. TaxID=1971397 RepID=UPI0039E8803F
MRNMGISNEISEIALNHVLQGMKAIYDVREEVPERRAALEQWANFIAECEMTALQTESSPQTCCAGKVAIASDRRLAP